MGISKRTGIVATMSCAGLLAAVAMLACGGRDGADGVDSNVTVALSEWALAVSTGQVAPGTVTFGVTNDGQAQHELVVVKNDLPPGELRLDGSRVDESKLHISARSTVLEPGASADLRLDATPGKYVLLCNLPEHYQNGVFTSFLVE